MVTRVCEQDYFSTSIFWILVSETCPQVEEVRRPPPPPPTQLFSRAMGETFDVLFTILFWCWWVCSVQCSVSSRYGAEVRNGVKSTPPPLYVKEKTLRPTRCHAKLLFLLMPPPPSAPHPLGFFKCKLTITPSPQKKKPNRDLSCIISISQILQVKNSQCDPGNHTELIFLTLRVESSCQVMASIAGLPD